jgi:uncharacterized damage-inducible protein DinB
MDLKEYLAHAYNYTYWANGRYLAVAGGLNEAQLHGSQGHSWGSVHSTLVHMMSSETVWLSRWHGHFPNGHLDPAAYPTIAALKESWAKIQNEMLSFLGQQSAESLLASRLYRSFQEEEFHVPLWQMMMHVPNHETHHRGELAAMFALMQVPHPEEEVIQYFLNLGGQKKY